MSEICAKKAATACVAHMLGVTGKTLIKWGKVDALFWGTAIPIFNTKYISEIATKYGLKDDYFSLEKVIKWENMSSLSHVKVNSMNVSVSRKDFYYLIVETCFVQCGAPMVQVNVENPALDDSLVITLYTVNFLRSSVYGLLSTDYCLRSVVHRLPSTVYYLLSTVYRLLSTVYCLPSTVYCLPSNVYRLLSKKLVIF